MSIIKSRKHLKYTNKKINKISQTRRIIKHKKTMKQKRLKTQSGGSGNMVRSRTVSMSGKRPSFGSTNSSVKLHKKTNGAGSHKEVNGEKQHAGLYLTFQRKNPKPANSYPDIEIIRQRARDYARFVNGNPIIDKNIDTRIKNAIQRSNKEIPTVKNRESLVSKVERYRVQNEALKIQEAHQNPQYRHFFSLPPPPPPPSSSPPSSSNTGIKPVIPPAPPRMPRKFKNLGGFSGSISAE